MKDFNPRPPRGGRPPSTLRTTRIAVFQSTPPARGATGGCKRRDNTETKISIHAPREGGDVNFGIEKKVYYYFNPRPPRGGRLPAAVPAQADVDFNPRPPRGGRLGCGSWNRTSSLFQSTPPARGATKHGQKQRPGQRNFNPRPPRGGRLYSTFTPRFAALFQSTPPARGATNREATPCGVKGISIHAPREGGDLLNAPIPRICLISIHAPREGGDSKDAQFYL